MSTRNFLKFIEISTKHNHFSLSLKLFTSQYKMPNNLRSDLARFSYFDDYSGELLDEVCRMTKRKKYKARDIIFGAKSGFKTYVYFVTSGICEIVEFISVKQQDFCVKVCALNELSCFNVGENLSDRIVVAVVETECLLVPYYWLVEHNSANIWRRIRQYLNRTIPTTEDLVRGFLQERKWMKYRKKLLRKIEKRKVAPLDYNDIPYSLKIEL